MLFIKKKQANFLTSFSFFHSSLKRHISSLKKLLKILKNCLKKRNFNPLHDTAATSQSFCHCMMAFSVDCFPPQSNKGRHVQSKRNPTRNCRSMFNACTRPIGYVSCDGGVIGFGAQHVPNTHLCTVGRTDGWMNDGGPASGEVTSLH